VCKRRQPLHAARSARFTANKTEPILYCPISYPARSILSLLKPLVSSFSSIFSFASRQPFQRRPSRLYHVYPADKLDLVRYTCDVPLASTMSSIDGQTGPRLVANPRSSFVGWKRPPRVSPDCRHPLPQSATAANVAQPGSAGI
jgi:hypothetical protein